MMSQRVIRMLLIIMDAFLALTSIAGGFALLAGIIAPPVDMLKGSPFSDYTVPGLALFVIVGGCALAATALLVRRHNLGPFTALISGIIIIIFEIVEVLSIGSEPGVARTLQIFYFGLGAMIIILTLGLLSTRNR